MDPAIQNSLARADAALKKGSKAEAAAAMHDAFAPMAAAPAADTALRAMTPMQATFMSLLAGDPDLAHQFAILAVTRAAEELEELCGAYKPLLDRQEYSGTALCFQAANYAVAFVPFVLLHPWIAWEDLLLSGDSGMNSMIVGMLRNMRPQLDKLGWAGWPYPPQAEKAVRYWSARALTDWGRLRMDNVASGVDVEAAQALAEASIDLIASAAEDQLTADALNLLGRVYNSYGDFKLTQEKAIPLFSESIRILEAIGNADDAAIDRGNLGGLLLGQAEFAAANGLNSDADKIYSQAEENLSLAVDAHRTCKFPEHLPGALINLAALPMSRKNWPKAEDACAQAVEAAKAAKSPFLTISALAQLGSAQLAQGKTRAADAEKNLRRAVALIEGPPAVQVEPETFALAYGTLGNALRIQDQPSEAVTFLSKAIERLETYSFSFFSERSKGFLFKTYRWIYEAQIDCHATLAGGKPELGAVAFNLAERIKWRTLTETLRYMTLNFPGMESDPLLTEERSLLAQIANPAMGTPDGVSPDLDTKAILHRLEEIWSALEPRFPEFVAIRRQKTVEAAEAITWLDDQVPTLVEYYLGNEYDTTLAFVLKKDAPWPSVARLQGSPAEIAAQVLALRPREGEAYPPPEVFNAASEQLHRALIAPLLAMLPAGSGVCFVPIGPLHNLPFAGLFDGSQYLIERNRVVVAPSATGLRWWRGHKSLHTPQSCLIAAFSTRSGVGEDLNEFKRLARNQIAALFSQSTVIPSEEATKAKLQAELAGAGGRQWDVVHIACHGNFKPDGLQSYLEVQPAPDGSDPTWTAQDIFTQVRTASTLVTLSACDSGIAQTSTNDEITGLAQAFLFGGASSVLASLWQLQQGIGVEITHDFYYLWMGLAADHQPHSKIEALQIALQARLRTKPFLWFERKPLSPYFWSAFQLYGDWR